MTEMATTPRTRPRQIVYDLKVTSINSGVSVHTLKLLYFSGKIKGLRAGAGKNGKILINWNSLCDFLEQGDIPQKGV